MQPVCFHRPQANSSAGTEEFCLLRRAVFVLLVASALVCCAGASATSVVALIDKENHKLVLAADCRVNHSAGSHSECKIVEEPGCTVVIAGLYREPSTGLVSESL